jgi:transposase-like protein
MLDFKNLKQLEQKLRTQEECIEYYESIRFESGYYCPHCNGEKYYRLKRNYKYRCAAEVCRKDFNVLTGTIFENTKIPLAKWFTAIYILTAHKKGISSVQLAIDLGVTQKTAWFISHRVREMLKDKAPELLSGEVEADETFLVGKDKNRHANKKRSEGRKGLTAIKGAKVMVGAIERGGKVVSKIVPDRSKGSIHPFLIENIKKGTVLYSDEYHGYYGLKGTFEQHRVNHGAKEYVRGNAHTNSIENYWSTLKRGIYGIYHQISHKHTQRYLDEFSFRFNTRGLATDHRFDNALRNADDRLKWDDLVKN